MKLGTLKVWLQDHDLSEDLIFSFARDICAGFLKNYKKKISINHIEGMSHLHKEGLVHRDLAARNLLYLFLFAFY